MVLSDLGCPDTIFSITYQSPCRLSGGAGYQAFPTVFFASVWLHYDVIMRRKANNRSGKKRGAAARVPLPTACRKTD